MHTESLDQWTHDHSFGQHRRRKGESRTLAVTAITGTMMAVEVAAGVAFGSMALLADGLHMASHAAALGISALGYYFARRHARDARFNFGTGKMNSLAAFASAVILAVVAVMMAWESVSHLLSPVAIDFGKAIPIAGAGLLVNVVSVLILGAGHEHEHHEGEEHHDDHHHEHDHNLLAAYLHVLADAITSVLAIVALLLGKFYGLRWLDPVMGLVGAGLVTHWASGLIKASGSVLLDVQAPAELRAKIRAVIENDADSRIADLHVWSVGPSVYAASIAVVSSAPKQADHYRALLPRELGLAHTTVEVHACSSRH
ncbi:MAG: CDF family Co(II)/Ni(II) efflux transporter DmeF [Elusimicrobia bacterium]|nr:CDF family Co(II)/Ni(II) efflux transporter DmeF [Elusimicrobiota bacterium]MDE2424476.1 CDF family Co(II)/Ni(II) efflux transporter DmeF [Elusimicrobiota bacterium]